MSHLMMKGAWHDVVVPRKRAEGAVAAALDQDKDEKALGTIMCHLDGRFRYIVVDAATAREAFESLVTAFIKPTGTRINDLSQQITTLQMKGEESMASYLSRGLELAVRLKELKHDWAMDQLPNFLLRGLDSRYNNLREIILNTLSSGEAPEFEDIREKLLNAESRMKRDYGLSNDREVAMAAIQGGGGRGGGRGFGSGGRGGHGGGGGRGAGYDTRPTCPCCKKKGHTADTCWTLHPELRPPRAAPEEEEKGKAITLAVVESSMTSWSRPPHSHLSFVMDNAASSHSVRDRSLLTDIVKEDTEVHGQYGKGLVKERGTARFLYGPDNVVVTLRNCLYSPDAEYNIFSLMAAEKEGAVYTQGGGTIDVLCRGVHITSQRNMEDKEPYLLHLRPFQPGREIAAATVVGAPAPTAALWHARMGHAAPKRLAQMVREGAVTGIGVPARDFDKLAEQQCEPCLQGKQTRSSLPKWPSDMPSVAACGEVVHTDVWGPYSTPDLEGNVSFVSVLDGYSGYAEILPLRSKDQASDRLLGVVRRWGTQFHHKVAAIRSDNGREFVQRALEEWYAKEGIQHQKTAPYHPEQNGKAERLNRTLLEKMRCMLHGAGLEDKLQLWGECLQTACFVYNRTAQEGLGGKTPHEVFTGVKPDVAHLRAFGCVAYVFVPKEQRTHKLQSRSRKGIYLGVAKDSKAYRVLLDGVVHVSPDVSFDETDTYLPFPSGAEEEEEEVPPPPHVAEEEEDSYGEFETADGSGSGEPDSPGGRAEAVVTPSAAAPVIRKSARLEEKQRRAEMSAAAVGVPVSSDEPTVAEALKSAEWTAAMAEEISSLEDYGTWKLVDLPKGERVLGSLWVLSTKRNEDGSIRRRKARLVANGSWQMPGFDVFETAAPTSSKTTLRCLLSKVAVENMEMRQLDVRVAFLNGELEEEIYIRQPQGFDDGSGRVCKLQKALYGLRQAPRQWHAKLKEVLLGLGFVVSESDPCLYILRRKIGDLYLLIYVDDMKLAAPEGDTASLDAITKQLEQHFDIHDEGEPRVFIGMEISRDREQRIIRLTQSGYAGRIVERFGGHIGSVRSLPMTEGLRLRSAAEGEEIDISVYPYREIVGSLLYLAHCTRPDISYAVASLARYMQKPGVQHWTAAVNLLGYLKGTRGMGLTYGGARSDGHQLVVYGDADFGGDLDQRRSTTGYVTMVNGGAIGWQSKLQPTVALSTLEAEYQAASMAAREALQQRKAFEDLSMGLGDAPVVIKCDNQGAISQIKNPLGSVRTKHIDVIHHFVRDRVERGEVVMEYCPTKLMVADILTKALGDEAYRACRAGLGLV